MATLFGALRASSLRAASKSPVLVLPIPRHRPLSTLNLLRNQRPQLNTRWRNARWNSSAASSSSILPPPTGETELVSNVEGLLPDTGVIADTIAAIPPLQHGDLQALGLCHWTPAGLMQYSFELMHVWTGLPWFHTFVAVSLFWRLVLFPFAVIGMRNSARMRPLAPQLTASAQAVQEARKIGDTVAMQKAALEGARIRASAGVSMGGLVAPLMQLPISIGMFFGVKKMCELPVMQLTQSGFEWLPDLTQPGPYYILPILVAASGNLMISMSARDMDTSRPGMGHLMNVVRVVTVAAIYWMNAFPSGLLITLLVTSLTSVLQSAIFRNPTTRAALNIPAWTPPPAGSPKLPTMRETFRHFFVNPAVQSSESAGVKHYVPPSATFSGAGTTVFKAQPVAQAVATAAKAPTQTPTTELMAQRAQAQARASTSKGSLFEDAAPALAPKPPKAASKTASPPTQKPTKAKAVAAKKPKGKSST